jgi:hypothetical protein
MAAMDEPGRTAREGDVINEQMIRDMDARRLARPERRQRVESSGSVTNERRRICAFCYQSGDHPTAAHCRRALER